ncbi:MAG: TonB-dependent receptor [Muribaculaceae bacterium]|nr:TonB-dependent receptor [Muribaculaceae bacterium]
MKAKLSILTIAIMMVIPALGRNIEGTVVGENNALLDFVNVVLYCDSTYLTGTITDAEGKFSVNTEAKGDLTAKITFVGYKPYTAAVPTSGNLGVITLEPETVMLGEVVVKSNRPVTTIKGDALVTNVAGSQLEHAGTANDVLTQVPMVLGRDGNFEVFGKGSPAIYVNGRELRDLSELSQINSADIKNIEVITNPGAKYDASVRSVIRIRTKKPQGEGFSGNIRAQGAWQKYFRNVDWANLKFRSGGLEVFGNFGLIKGKFYSNGISDILTRSSAILEETLSGATIMHSNEFFGKAGISYLINDRHSIGASYSNGIIKWKEASTQVTSIISDGILLDNLNLNQQSRTNTLPKHYANIYYNGNIARLGIDFNMDYLWRKVTNTVWGEETSEFNENSIINSTGHNRGRMFAEKLVLSYPLWKGSVEAGEEFTSSRVTSDYITDATIVGNADTRVDEKNIAGFIDIAQSFGIVNASVGLRYERVKFNYFENGQRNDDQSRVYNNLFPSLSVSTMISNVQLAFNYTHKTQRPGYSDLDGTIGYINRLTLESGNPYLKPEKSHSLELTGAWRQFFGQLSYTYKKDPIMNTTRSYGEDGVIKLITLENFPKIQNLQAFIGAQFQLGIWQPRVNVGIMKQWLTIDTAEGRKSLDNPIGLVQFQNAIHLPGDIWMNVDMQWMSAGNDKNSFVKSSSFLNAKLYKAFFGNKLGISVEVTDIFNKGNRYTEMINKDVTVSKLMTTNNRTFMLTLQYSFNTSRDRYRGQGAGTNEMNRF